MSVGILLVTHEAIGAQLIEVAASIINQPARRPSLVAVPADLEPELLGSYADMIRDAMRELDSGQGVLVLTDLYGATPDNLARHFANELPARVVSGINLPMLLRVLNYAHQPLAQLCETATAGGLNGVIRDRE